VDVRVFTCVEDMLAVLRLRLRGESYEWIGKHVTFPSMGPEKPGCSMTTVYQACQGKLRPYWFKEAVKRLKAEGIDYWADVETMVQKRKKTSEGHIRALLVGLKPNCRGRDQGTKNSTFTDDNGRR